MRRREFVGAVMGMMALSFAARAQQPEQMRSVGVLMGFPENDSHAQGYVQVFRERLKTLGWVEGRNIRFDYRWPGGDLEMTRRFAKELVSLAPSVILTSTNQATAVMRDETSTIPIVFASLGDPVESGLVDSLNRPGGNVTGFPAFVGTVIGKWLELLHEIAPRVTRVGFLYHPDAAPHRGLLRAAQAAAPSLGIDLIPLPIHNTAQIEASLATFGPGPEVGLMAGGHAVTFSSRSLIINTAISKRMPTAFGEPVFVESGGLLCYGSDINDFFRGAASYVDLILKGAKVAQLPVQLPTNFELTLNLKTAEAIGLTVPPSLYAAAKRVIE